MYLQRNGFNIEIICMTCAEENITTFDSQTKDCFPYKNDEVGLMTGSFFWGYAVTQAFSGLIMRNVGLSFNIKCAIFLSSLSTFLIPFSTYGGYQMIMFLRVITGVGQGFLWPFIQMIVSFWSPEDERSIHMAIITCGLGIGPAVAFVLSGVFCELILPYSKHIFSRNGWALYFYFSGIVGFLDLLLSFILLTDRPQQSKFISQSEVEYIRGHLRGSSDNSERKIPIRWKLIMTSIPFWAFLFSLSLCDIGLYAVWTVVPQFMADIIKFDITENGIYNSLPYIFNVIAVILTGFLSKYVIGHKWLSESAACKTFHSFGIESIFSNFKGCVCSAICLILITFTSSNSQAIAIILLIIGFASHGVIFAGGIILNCNDFAGQLSGVVFTVGNTVSAIIGFFVPYLTSMIVKNSTITEWRYAFITYACCYILSALVFVLLGSSQLQTWALANLVNENENQEETILEEISDKT